MASKSDTPDTGNKIIRRVGAVFGYLIFAAVLLAIGILCRSTAGFPVSVIVVLGGTVLFAWFTQGGKLTEPRA